MTGDYWDRISVWYATRNECCSDGPDGRERAWWWWTAIRDKRSGCARQTGFVEERHAAGASRPGASVQGCPAASPPSPNGPRMADWLQRGLSRFS